MGKIGKNNVERTNVYVICNTGMFGDDQYVIWDEDEDTKEMGIEK